MSEELRWILGSIGSIAGVFLIVWWKIEARQDKKIDDFKESNGDDHVVIHKKIDKLQDKVQDIWKHLVDHK